jgi:hypothetical protein
MKPARIFYRPFPCYPPIFWQLTQLAPTVSVNYRFDSVEVKQQS